MPRFTDEFIIRYDKNSKKYLLTMPMWFMHSMGWNLAKDLKLQPSINPNSGEVTFSSDLRPIGELKFGLLNSNYWSKINKKKYRELLSVRKDEAFKLLSEKDRGLLFSDSEKERLKKEVNSEFSNITAIKKNIKSRRGDLKLELIPEGKKKCKKRCHNVKL